MTLLDDLQRFPVTAILIIGAVATFIAGETGRSLVHLVVLSGTELTEPWRLVTSIFPHGGVFHLVFNAWWVWQLGRPIEARLGPGWMIALTLLGALVSSGLQVSFSGPGIGLSGVVFAYAFFAYARGRYDPRFAGIVDERIARFFVIWFFLCIVLTEAGIMPIANAAHLGGGLIGYTLGARRRWMAPVLLAGVVASLVFVRPLLGASDIDALRRSADYALEAEDPTRALELYERALEAGDERLGTRHNYGIALRDVGRTDEAWETWWQVIQANPNYYEPELKREIDRRHGLRAAAPD